MSDPRGSPRHRSRQAALQVLYAADLVARRGSGATPVDVVFDGVAENFELPEGARAFAAELVAGVAAARDELDQLLARHARNWKLSRMAAVDRNVLRLAAWELTRTDTPTSVLLDEAIELARRFGAESSPAFVNGVLDAVAREVRPQGRAQRPAGERSSREQAVDRAQRAAGERSSREQAVDRAQRAAGERSSNELEADP